MLSLNTREVKAGPTLLVNCNDAYLTSLSCVCTINSNIQSMNCNGNYLPNSTLNILPNISVSSPPLGIQIKNT